MKNLYNDGFVEVPNDMDSEGTNHTDASGKLLVCQCGCCLMSTWKCCPVCGRPVRPDEKNSMGFLDPDQ